LKVIQTLTREEQLAVARYVTDPRGRVDTFFSYAIYFVPSLLFGLYGIWKADVVAVSVSYAVLFVLVFYLISYNRRSAPLLKLVEDRGATGEAAPQQPG
jgi:hypothetical protein